MAEMTTAKEKEMYCNDHLQDDRFCVWKKKKSQPKTRQLFSLFVLTKEVKKKYFETILLLNYRGQYCINFRCITQ